VGLATQRVLLSKAAGLAIAVRKSHLKRKDLSLKMIYV
jgi:hypothetical protein